MLLLSLGKEFSLQSFAYVIEYVLSKYSLLSLASLTLCSPQRPSTVVEWRIDINVSKSTAIIFAGAGRRFIQPRPVIVFGEPIQWVETTHYLGVTLDK